MTESPLNEAAPRAVAEKQAIPDRIDVVAAKRTLRLEPDLEGMSHELGVELAAVRSTISEH
jgi:hypothetical protein